MDAIRVRSSPPTPVSTNTTPACSPRSIYSGLLEEKADSRSGRAGDNKCGDAAVLVADGEGVQKEDFAEEQRHTMRVALARRMKRELIDSEQDRLTRVGISMQQSFIGGAVKIETGIPLYLAGY